MPSSSVPACRRSRTCCTGSSHGPSSTCGTRRYSAAERPSSTATCRRATSHASSAASSSCTGPIATVTSCGPGTTSSWPRPSTPASTSTSSSSSCSSAAARSSPCPTGGATIPRALKSAMLWIVDHSSWINISFLSLPSFNASFRRSSYQYSEYDNQSHRAICQIWRRL